MKKYILLLLFALVTNVTLGQSNYQDVVSKKKPDIVDKNKTENKSSKQEIVDKDTNDKIKSIKIETFDKNVFIDSTDEVEKTIKEGKMYGIVELGYQIGELDGTNDILKLNIINGYQINPYFSWGIGTGLRNYFDGEWRLIPIFLDFRWFADINDEVSPYFSWGLGYSVIAINEVGVMIYGSLGKSFRISNTSRLNISLGSEFHFFTRSTRDLRTEILKAFSIDIGITY